MQFVKKSKAVSNLKTKHAYSIITSVSMRTSSSEYKNEACEIVPRVFRRARRVRRCKSYSYNSAGPGPSPILL